MATDHPQDLGPPGSPLSEPGFNPEDFRVPANDTNGHSEREWFRIQPGHDRQIDTIVGGRVFPYRSKGDLIRHAVVRHLAWLETLAPIPSVTRQVDAIIEIIREEEFNSDFKDVFERLAERVGSYMSQGQVSQARSIVSRVKNNIDRMPAGLWRDQYLAEINSRWGSLFEMNTGVADLIGGDH